MEIIITPINQNTGNYLKSYTVGNGWLFLQAEASVRGTGLSESHETGKSKANFFMSYGFHSAYADELGREIKNVAERYLVRYEIKSEYVIDGTMLTPTDDAVTIFDCNK